VSKVCALVVFVKVIVTFGDRLPETSRNSPETRAWALPCAANAGATIPGVAESTQTIVNIVNTTIGRFITLPSSSNPPVHRVGYYIIAQL
jgi:hypothetical protein